MHSDGTKEQVKMTLDIVNTSLTKCTEQEVVAELKNKSKQTYWVRKLIDSLF